MSWALRDIRNGVELEAAGMVVNVNGISLPVAPVALQYPRLGQGGIVAPATTGGGAWAFKGTWRQLNPGGTFAGSWAAAADYAGNAVWQEVALGGQSQPFAGGQTSTIAPWSYQSAGILDIDPAGTIWMDDGQPWTWRRKDGSILVMPKAVIRAGMAAGYAIDWDGVVAYNIAADALYDVWRGSPQNIPVRLDDDGATVAISGDNQGFFPADEWTLVPPVLPTYQPTPLTRPAYFCAFLASGVIQPPDWCNAWILKDVTHMFTHDGQQWNVRLLEAGTGSTESPCVYVGSPEAFELSSFSVTKLDIVAPWFYREPGQSDADFDAFAFLGLQKIRKMYPGITLMPIWNDTTRIGASGPTLTKDEVLSGLVIGSSFGLDACIFESGRAGEVLPEAPQLLTQWRNGQPCPVQVLPPPVQHSASGARRRR